MTKEEPKSKSTIYWILILQAPVVIAFYPHYYPMGFDEWLVNFTAPAIGVVAAFNRVKYSKHNAVKVIAGVIMALYSFVLCYALYSYVN